MATLQELIERYLNGDDDADEQTAVPRSSTFAGRRANSGKVGVDDSAEGLCGDDDDANNGDGEACETAAAYPIFIPSKGRYDAHRPGTCALLARSRIGFTVVVEPQEAADYRAFLGRLEGYDPMLHAVAVLPASHQGVSYVRNHIAKHLAPPTGWFWQMDDDIRAFSQSLGDKKNTAISPRTFFKEFAARMRKHPTAALFSAEYEMFAFSYGPGDVAINSYNNIAKLFRRECMPAVVPPLPAAEAPTEAGAEATGVAAEEASASSPKSNKRGRPAGKKSKQAAVACEADDTAAATGDEAAPMAAAAASPPPVGTSPGDVYRFKLREDYDMVLRMIANGHCAVRFRDLSFRVPAMAECSGGMTEYYTTQRPDIREQNRLFVTEWPMVAREVLKGAGKDLRFDIKVNWAALNPKGGARGGGWGGATPQQLLSRFEADGVTPKHFDIEALLITDEAAADATKLREREAALAASNGIASGASKIKTTSTWAASRGRGGVKTEAGDDPVNGTRAVKRGKGNAASLSKRGGGGGKSGRATRQKRRRPDDSGDEDDVCDGIGIVEDDDDEAEVHTVSSNNESEAADFDSDDDDDDDSASSFTSSSSSGGGGSGMEGDGDEEDEEDEELYFAVMEEFYNPRKARARERAEAEAAARAAAGLGPKEDEEDNANADTNVKPKPKPRAKRPPPPPPKPMEERAPAGWAGYAMVMWRDVEPEAAEECGLRHINPARDPTDAAFVSEGSTVAFVPLSYEVSPSVMEGTIIAVHEGEGTVQIAPGRRYRGVPLQTIAADRLYKPCADAAETAKCAAALDELLDPPAEAIVEVTRTNVRDLVAKASHL